MSILHRGGMCHRFLPVPLSPGATMRIRGQGPFLRASIHISGPGRVQSARVYMHTRIHIYRNTPAHRGAAGLPQGSRWCPNAAAGPFCGPWHTPRAAAGSVSGPHEVRAGPRRCGRGALLTAPTKPRVVPGSPWRGCSPVAIRCRTWPPANPGVAALGRASGATPAPSYGLAPPARAYPSDVVPPSRAPRSPPAGPPAAPERPGAAATKAANRWQIPAWFGRDAGAAPTPARVRLQPLPKKM